MRTLALLLILLLPSCGSLEREREEAAAAARAATLAEVEELLVESLARADGVAASADRILSPLPVMTPAEERALRRFLGAAHVAEARAVGVRVGNEEERDALVDEGTLVELADSTEHWMPSGPRSTRTGSAGSTPTRRPA